MNDFTKEELLTLKDAIQIYLRTPSPIEAEQLRDKLRSMIDNHHEHNYVKTLDKSGMFFISMCHECKDTKPWGIADE